MEKKNWNINYLLGLAWLFLIVPMTSLSIRSQDRPVFELYSDASNYIKVTAKELSAEGKKVDAEKRVSLAREQQDLAKKYSTEVSARSDIKGLDVYYLALLFDLAGNDDKTLETMRRFLAQYPPETKGDAIQSARSHIVVIAAKQKQFADAERMLGLWVNGIPHLLNQRPALEAALAVCFYKDGKYEEAIKYAQAAFEHLKEIEAKNLVERRSKMGLYGDIVEVLALSYRKGKNNDLALNVLAEGRALSFTIPSATLYRRVMDIVEGSGFSEKKLMQKVESYRNADPIPELAIQDWVGQDAVTLESLRGKVVLLDFWATWCGPCISTFPRLRDWHKKYSGNGLTIIGVTQFYGEADGKPMTQLQELDYLAEFKTKYKMPYGIAVAKRGEDAAKYDINAYPTTMLLDKNGVIRYIGIGSSKEESENLENMIKKLLVEGDPSSSSKDQR